MTANANFHGERICIQSSFECMNIHNRQMSIYAEKFMKIQYRRGRVLQISIGQKWISQKYPHENFIIYDGIPDEKILFWRRSNHSAFEQFIIEKKGHSIDELITKGKNTYPYAWAGECSIRSLKSKIKKYEMILL